MAMSLAAGRESDPMLEMNTTPLIDVLLVLLILFIITLPVMSHNTGMDLGGKPGPEPQRDAISLSIEFDGTIVLNGTPVENLQRLEEHFRAAAMLPEQPASRAGSTQDNSR